MVDNNLTSEMMDKLIIVMPVYNEEANIDKTIKDWHPITSLGKDSKLLLINDGSKDKSLELIQKAQNTYPNLIYIDKENEGHGPSILRGYKKALELGADYVFQTDSDGQTNPEEFYAFWENKELFDVQIGCRRNRGDGFSRKIVSFVLRLVLFFYFRVWTLDPNTPFRLFNKKSLKRFLPLIPDDFLLTNAALSAFAQYDESRVSYKNITFKPRVAGTNSINLKRILSIAVQTIKELKSLRVAMRLHLKKGFKNEVQ